MGKKNLKVKDEDFAKMEKVTGNSSDLLGKKKINFYLSYHARIWLIIVVAIILAIVSYLCFSNSFSDSKEVNLKYNEGGSLKYNVSLIQNNPFESGNLTPQEYYLSDVINDVGVDFNYNYKLSDKADLDYSYYVTKTMILRNKKDGSIVSKTENRLVDNVYKNENDVSDLSINQNVNIDYDSDNELARVIEDQYKLDVDGSIVIKMYITLNTNYDKFDHVIKKEKVLETELPLLSTNVKLGDEEIKTKEDSYVNVVKPRLENKVLLYIGIIIFILDIVFILCGATWVVNSLPKRSKYCRLRDGLLKDYNKVIVSSKNLPKFSNYHVIDCFSFNELLDAQGLLNRPIIYYEIIKNQKCVFVIIGEAELYRYVLKECDLDY